MKDGIGDMLANPVYVKRDCFGVVVRSETWRVPTPTMRQDPCGRAGAAEIAESIRRYWLDRGEEVEMQIVSLGDGAQCSVRSNMVDGLPRRGNAQ